MRRMLGVMQQVTKEEDAGSDAGSHQGGGCWE